METMEQQGEWVTTRPAAAAIGGTDAWSREARRVREVATRLGLTLDAEELALQDVRDLQALGKRLQRAAAWPHARRWPRRRPASAGWGRKPATTTGD